MYNNEYYWVKPGKTPLCKFIPKGFATAGVECCIKDRRCEACGWNPAVADYRTHRINVWLAGSGEIKGFYNTIPFKDKQAAAKRLADE